MEKEIKYYTSSDGTRTPIKEVHSEHLINALGKRYKDLFTSENKEQLSAKLKEINDIKEEIYSRINDFSEGIGE